MDNPFKLGDLVWLFTKRVKKGLSKKLKRMWIGPFRIIAMTSPVNVKLQRLNKRTLKQVVHIARLKLYEGPQKPKEELWLEDEDFDMDRDLEEEGKRKEIRIGENEEGEDEMETDETRDYEVERIEGVANKGGKRQYLVRWRGYSDDLNSWEPLENLNCDRLIEEYHRRSRTWCNKCGFGATSEKGLERHWRQHEVPNPTDRI
jgi:Chromo (CHRromatin Organisation MOdifier) domain